MMNELALTSPNAPARLKKCIELRHEIAETMATLKRLRHEEDTVLERLIQDFGMACKRRSKPLALESEVRVKP